MVFQLGWMVASVLASTPLLAQETRVESSASAGVVCQVKVVSDKVPDLSTLETWKKAFIKEGMTAEQKAMAVWRRS